MRTYYDRFKYGNLFCYRAYDKLTTPPLLQSIHPQNNQSTAIIIAPSHEPEGVSNHQQLKAYQITDNCTVVEQLFRASNKENNKASLNWLLESENYQRPIRDRRFPDSNVRCPWFVMFHISPPTILWWIDVWLVWYWKHISSSVYFMIMIFLDPYLTNFIRKNTLQNQKSKLTI